MLIDASVTIAYKCASCGSFEFFNISLFTFLYKKESTFSCRCRKSSIAIMQEGDSGYLIKTPCIGCGSDHIYMLGKKDILLKTLNAFNCPETGMQLCFLGKDEAVRKKVDSLEEEFDELMDMFGYESYFKNTQVMFDSLNRIHDIAEQGNLYCECGCTQIELVLLADRILLKCGKCNASKIIYAASNGDLKELLMMYQISISEETDYFVKNRKGLLEKRTGNKSGK
jgi:hypothetical protein